MKPYTIKAEFGNKKFTCRVLAETQEDAIQAVRNGVNILKVIEEPTQAEQRMNDNINLLNSWFI